MSVSFRTAGTDDAEALARLGAATFVETFGHLYRPADLAAFLVNHDPAAWRAELADPAFAVLVGETDGEAVAYAKIGPAKLPFTPPDGAVELRQFYVRHPFHGTGVAADMMAWAIAEARRRDATSLYLSVFVDNIRAQRFYERYGFVRIGDYAFMVGEHEDKDHVMRLAL